MNKQEVLSLKPGKELDLLIEDKVLGIISKEDKPNKSYSTDSREMWTIINSMVKRKFIYSLSNSEKKHTCAFDNLDTHRRFIVHENTLIEAICKAALLAVQGHSTKSN